MSEARILSDQVPYSRITAERYVSRDYMERERERLWGKAWLVAGCAQDVADPGDFFVFDLEPESILVSRSEAGELRAFFNVCQHRGARLVGSDLGSMEKYTCPYHGWTYNNDGSLCHVPDKNRFNRGIPEEQLKLPELRVADWGGMIWVCMDDQAPSLEEFLGPIIEMIEPFRPHDMRLVEDQTCRLECNWKAVFDNFGELYHVEHIHPQHELIFDCPTSTAEHFDYGHTRVLIDGFTVNSRLPIPDEVPPTQWAQMETLGMDKDDYQGRVLDVRRDIQIKKRELGPALGYNYDLLSDEQLSDIVQYNVFPNAVLVLQPEEFWILRSRPHATDPNKCYWDKFALRMLPDVELQKGAKVEFPPLQNRANVSFNLDQNSDGTIRPEHDEFDQEAIIAGEKTMTITLDQDIHLIRDVQKGMQSRGFREAWLNEDESRVQHYHTWIDRYMED
ncbi:MAG: Rieske 2Fe-2S domain-containing protein [Pseudomonadales bacterium]|nr:Rieske 2Fe-2S domain-containing protein [Pseudomonadales bacterium]MBO6701956.1 Rieske 2Fe-2S domain-containing protein [Pseudomonadales bacterium]